MERDETEPLRLVVLALGLVLGVWLRLESVADNALFGDEYHTRMAAERTLGDLVTRFDDVGSHIVVPLLQHVSSAVFGEGPLPFRLPALVPGILTLLLFYPLTRRLFGPTPALLGTVALAISPMHVYYSRFGRAYALIVFLGVLLVALLARVLERGRVQRRSRALWAGVFAVAALLPYTHLSSTGLVVTLGLAALALAWRRGGTPRAALVPLAVFAGAAALSAALFLPVIGQVSGYFVENAENQDLPSTWFGIPVLLAGGSVAAIVWLAGFPLALIALARERPGVALLSGATLAGPLAVLIVTLPHGMEYAYARYLLCAVPFVPVVLAHGLTRMLGERFALAAGVPVLALLYLTGPLPGPFASPRPASPAFDNSYLAMRELPAFDVPWEGASPIYTEIAEREGDVRVVEATPLITRAVLLYRNFALQHGKRVAMAWSEKLPTPLRGGPYVELAKVSGADADYVIVHRDLPREIRRYWRFVYDEVWARDGSSLDRGFMLRHRATFVAGWPVAAPSASAEFATYLRDRHGPAYYKDDDVIVWRFE